MTVGGVQRAFSPGAQTHLSITAAAGAKVSLIAVDKAVYFLNQQDILTKDEVNGGRNTHLHIHHPPPPPHTHTQPPQLHTHTVREAQRDAYGRVGEGGRVGGIEKRREEVEGTEIK